MTTIQRLRHLLRLLAPALSLLVLTGCDDHQAEHEPAAQRASSDDDPWQLPAADAATALPPALSAAFDGGWVGDAEVGDSGLPEIDRERRIGHAFWYMGWKVTLHSAHLTVEEGNDFGVLELPARFEHLMPEEFASFPYTEAEIILSAGDEYYRERRSETPTVRGLGQGEGAFRFRVPRTIDLDSTTLIVGGLGYAEAHVPLGPGGLPLVSLEPKVLPINKTLQTGNLKIDVRQVRVEAHQNGTVSKHGRRWLIVVFDAEVLRGSSNVSWEKFSVQTPNGPLAAQIGGKFGLLYATDRVPDMWVYFNVPEPHAGEYTLTLHGTTDPDVSLPFTLL